LSRDVACSAPSLVMMLSGRPASDAKKKDSPHLEISNVLHCLDHVATFIEYADHSVV
jgi:hypothetical protein